MAIEKQIGLRCNEDRENEWLWNGHEWQHCKRRAWVSDEGLTCSKCQETETWED